MHLTGFADEAADGMEDQIRATKMLGWKYIEARNINGTNIHDLSDGDFDLAAGKLEEADVKINCFGSTIANWAKSINEPFDTSVEEARRAIPRMKRLGTKLIRIMSFAVLKDYPPESQMEEERFRRVRIICKMFTDEGLLPVRLEKLIHGIKGGKLKS